MYYGTSFDNRIAVAVSANPAGPFEYYGEVHYADGTRYGGRPQELIRFDPGVLTDDYGRIWLYTGFCPTLPIFQLLAKMNRMTINALGNQVAELAQDMLTIITDPVYLLPGKDNSNGTGFEGHEFYEASSIRKFHGKYYAIYSTYLSHELAYAVSEYPNRDFHYGGTLHSNGNILAEGETPEYFWGNNHGSIELVNGRYYVFGHRQTNCNECSRQGVAEPIRFENGKFFPAEMTSQGLYGEPLPLDVTYEAGIACVLYGKQGALKITKARKSRFPYITQEGFDREHSPKQFVANIHDSTTVGYKYFDFTYAESIALTLRGWARGELLLAAKPDGIPFCKIPLNGTLKSITSPISAPRKVSALYFRFKGLGCFDLIDLRITGSARKA
jgi:hypothetical protein